MSRSKCDVSLILACYNEAGHLEESVRQILTVLDGTRWAYEVIFVDDCSADETSSLIDDLIRRDGSRTMSKLSHARNLGRGRTVCDGFRQARGEVVGYIDVDLEVHPRYVPSCVQAIHEGADAAYAKRIYQVQPSILYRHVMSRGYSIFAQRLLGISLSDTESGYKFFRREKLLPLLEVATDPGWFWDTEIMTHFCLAGYSIAEVPALFVRRKDKKSSVRVVHDSARQLAKLLQFRSVVSSLRRASGLTSTTSCDR
jgi:glycosyltransferase involved in cell wall biosynthesis